jgi:hypothetical protein
VTGEWPIGRRHASRADELDKTCCAISVLSLALHGEGAVRKHLMFGVLADAHSDVRQVARLLVAESCIRATQVL